MTDKEIIFARLSVQEIHALATIGIRLWTDNTTGEVRVHAKAFNELPDIKKQVIRLLFEHWRSQSKETANAA